MRLYKQWWTWVLGLVLLLGMLMPPVVGQAAVDQEIHAIDVQVDLHRDGSATIHENWSMTTKEGTEIYKPLNLARGQKLSDYTVSMDGQAFTYNDDWDVDDSFGQKAGTYGYNDKEELNWGITDYGRHQYTVSYTITPFVMQTTTDQMIFWQFINEGLAVPPESIKITLHSDLGAMTPDEHYNVWGFGFTGETRFSAGDIIAESTYRLTADGKGVLLVHIPNGAFQSPLPMKQSFDDYAKSAFAGSSYNYQDYQKRETLLSGGNMPMTLKEKLMAFGGIALVVVISGAFIVGMLQLFYQGHMHKKGQRRYYPSLKRRSQDLQGVYYRTLPTPNVFAGYCLLKDLAVKDLDNHYFTVALLTLVQAGAVNLSEDPKGQPALRLTEAALPTTPGVIPVWTLLKEAMRVAGNEGLLTQKQLEHYMEDHTQAVVTYIEEVTQLSKDFLKEAGWAKSPYAVKKKTLRDWADEAVSVPLTEAGFTGRDHYVAFYNYLKDFSLINERGANEVKVWDQLLIYAAALGIADEVAKTFAALDPQFVSHSALLTPQFSLLDYYLWSNVMHHSYLEANFPSASASAGLGGGTSFGGGGGSFGGGVGGGAR